MSNKPKTTDMSMPIQEPKKAEGSQSKKEDKQPKAARVRGKKYTQAKVQVDKNKTYALPQAIELVKKTSYSAFDGTVEIHLVVRKSGLTTNVAMPHAAGKAKKIEVADENTLKKLASGKIDFDILLATADMMPKLVPFARILGPKGMMPNPKTGTLIKSVKDAAKFSSNTVTLKTEKTAPLIHTSAGKVSQKSSELADNVEAILTAINKRQILKAYLKATMGPSIKLAL